MAGYKFHKIYIPQHTQDCFIFSTFFWFSRFDRLILNKVFRSNFTNAARTLTTRGSIVGVGGGDPLPESNHRTELVFRQQVCLETHPPFQALVSLAAVEHEPLAQAKPDDNNRTT